MNTILDDESFSVDERLEMAKEFLSMKDAQIQRLEAQLCKEKSTREWIQDQTGTEKMGL